MPTWLVGNFTQGTWVPPLTGPPCRQVSMTIKSEDRRRVGMQTIAVLERSNYPVLGTQEMKSNHYSHCFDQRGRKQKYRKGYKTAENISRLCK